MNINNQVQGPQTSREYFRSLNIIYFAFLAGIIIMMVMVTFLKMLDDFVSIPPGQHYIFKIVGSIIFVIDIIGSILYPQMKIKKLSPDANIKVKMQEYRSITIVRLALIEGVLFLMIMMWLLTGNNFFLIYLVLLICWYFFQYPSINKASRELNLGVNEKAIIEDPRAIIC